MEINTLLSAAAGAATGTSTSAADSGKLADNFDQFLTLLTTQLKYQDPLDPLKSNEFISQLVSFSQVEQSIKSNKNLESLLSLQSANQAVGALGFIGRTVEASGTSLPLVNGQGRFAYTLSAPSATTTIAILDSDGHSVFAADGETAQGKHELTWDGRDINGNTLPDGTYKLVVVARDADDQQIDLSTSIFGKVDGITAGSDGLVMSIGPVQIPASSVISVKDETTTEAPG